MTSAAQNVADFLFEMKKKKIVIETLISYFLKCVFGLFLVQIWANQYVSRMRT